MRRLSSRALALAVGMRSWSSESMSGYQVGKVPPDILRSAVFGRLGRPSCGDVVVGPRAGEDAAVIQCRHGAPIPAPPGFLGSRIVVSSDPITGSTKALGQLAVHVNANDVAVAGARPQWLVLTLLLPPIPDGKGDDYVRETVEGVMQQAHDAALKLGVAIVGGHTEFTAAVTQPVCVGTMFGELPSHQRVRSTSHAHAGCSIVLTKSVGIEGTAVLLSEGRGVSRWHRRGVVASEAEGERAVLDALAQVSVVPEAMIAAAVDEVVCMHDPTEGGVCGALHEVADSSGTGFRIESSRATISPVTQRLCRALSINPWNLLSSGALLIYVSGGAVAADKVVAALSAKGITASRIGEVVEHSSERVHRPSGNEPWRPMDRPIQDALWDGLKAASHMDVEDPDKPRSAL